MPKRKLAVQIKKLARQLGPNALKKLEKTAYFIQDEVIKSKRRIKLPPVRKVPLKDELAKTLAKWDKKAGFKKQKPGVKIAQPDMHDSIKKLPKFKVKPLVKNLKIKRGGTFLQFDFETNIPCWAIVGVSKASLSAVKVGNKYQFYKLPEHLGTNMLGPARKSHSIAAVHLQPTWKFNTDSYHYVILIKPKDKDTPMPAPLSGSAKTRRRHVLLTVDSVQVVDATDFDGKGEMYFKTQIGHAGFNFNKAGNSLDHAIYPANNDNGSSAGPGFMKVSSGDTVNLNFSLSGHEMRESFEHTFSAVENDAGSAWPGSLETYGTNREPDVYAGTYDTGSFEANSSYWTYNIDGHSYMSGNTSDTLAQRETWLSHYVRHVSDNALTDLDYYIYGSILVYYDFEL